MAPASVSTNGTSSLQLHNYVLERLPVALPYVELQDEQCTETVAENFLERIHSLHEDDFGENATWRDMMALTGTFRSFFSGLSILAAWKELCQRQQTNSFEVQKGSTRVMRTPSGAAWIMAEFTFRVEQKPARTCVGSLSLIPDDAKGWKLWALTTVIDQLLGHPSVDRYSLENGVSATDHNHVNGEIQPLRFGFDTVIVGAGQAGLALAGRLKALGVSYVVVDQIKEIGDNWISRYESTRLHTPREFAHLPFERTFTSSFQEYLDKHDLAKGFKAWTTKYNINTWLSTRVTAGKFHADEQRYTLDLSRDGQPVSITCSHLILATGGYGPHLSYPQYPNREEYSGTVLHSTEYKEASTWKGRKGIVVGTANTAHDVAEDMLDAGLSSVTMVQRGTTSVIPVEHFKSFSDALYNSHIPTELADRLSYSIPWSVSRLYVQDFLRDLASKEPERFDALERASFKTERYGDLTYHLTVRRGGHYMDVGTSANIAKGLIKVKSDSAPVRYTSKGLLFADGSHLDADVIVFATGFSGNLQDTVEELLGPEVADKGGAFWGLDEEGEIRGAFKPLQQPRLWYAAGTLGHTRYFSRFVALQIRADLDGVPFQVYHKTPSSGLPAEACV